MKKLVILSFIIATVQSVSAQRIYVEDMAIVRNALPQIPTTIEAIKKSCPNYVKNQKCDNIKRVLTLNIQIRMDSISTPQAMVAETQNIGTEALRPEFPDKRRERMKQTQESIDSMETLMEREKVVTKKNGKIEFGLTPEYMLAKDDLERRLKTMVLSNTYYRMNYEQREKYRESVYIQWKLSQLKMNYLLAYERLIFEREKISIMELLPVCNEKQAKFAEIQTETKTAMKTMGDSVNKAFEEISTWKQKELEKAKTPAEKIKISEQATTKHKALLQSTQQNLLNRYAGLKTKIDQQLDVLNQTLKNYEFGINAKSNQERQMQGMAAQAQLSFYVTLNTLADFCVFSEEILLKYADK